MHSRIFTGNPLGTGDTAANETEAEVAVLWGWQCRMTGCHETGHGGLGGHGTRGKAPILGSAGFKEDLFLFLPLASPSTQVFKPKGSTPSWVFLLPLLPQIHPC